MDRTLLDLTINALIAPELPGDTITSLEHREANKLILDYVDQQDALSGVSIPPIEGKVPFEGVADGATVITLPEWAGISRKRITFIRNGFVQDSYDPGDGSTYFTKVDAEDFITVFTALAAGEKVKINTI